jgi:hypothetical protein
MSAEIDFAKIGLKYYKRLFAIFRALSKWAGNCTTWTNEKQRDTLQKPERVKNGREYIQGPPAPMARQLKQKK